MVACADVALARAREDLQIFLQKVDAALHVVDAALFHRMHDFTGVARSEECVDLFETLAVLGAERLELGLQRVADERFCITAGRELLDVELIKEHRFELACDLQRTVARHRHLRKGLAVFEVARVARRTAEGDDFENILHAAFEFGVDARLVADGEIAQMHRFGRFGIERRHEVLIHHLRHEGRIGREELGKRCKDGVERRICRRLVLRHVAAPIAVAAAADVPIAEHVAKILDLARAVRDVVLREHPIDVAHHRVEAGEHPAVHEGELALFKLEFGRIVFIDLGIEREEGVGIPERALELTLHLADGFRPEAGRDPRRGVGVEVPSDGVGALLVEHRPGIDDVALVLAHLDAVLIVDVAQNDAVLEGRAAEEDGRDGEQRIEPAARLIDRLRNEICGEGLFEEIFVLEGIVVLREGHGTRIEPAVDDLGRALHLAAALGAGADEIV